MNDEGEAHLRSIRSMIDSLIELIKQQKQVQDDHTKALETILDTQEAFLRRIEILELRRDIQEPK